MSWARRMQEDGDEKALKWLKESPLAEVIDMAQLTQRVHEGKSLHDDLDGRIFLALKGFVAEFKTPETYRGYTVHNSDVAEAHDRFLRLVSDRYIDELELYQQETPPSADELRATLEKREAFLQSQLGYIEFEPISIEANDPFPAMHMTSQEHMIQAVNALACEKAADLLDTVETALAKQNSRGA